MGVNDKGYVESHEPDHPLAEKSGRLLEHRRVLYDHFGPADQPCYWCGWVLPWRHPSGHKWCINVDHLNEDRQDNRVTNLVPSCWYCNANRSWSRIAPLVWLRLIRSHHITTVHPAERESAILRLARRLNDYMAAEVVLPEASTTPTSVVLDEGSTTTPKNGNTLDQYHSEYHPEPPHPRGTGSVSFYEKDQNGTPAPVDLFGVLTRGRIWSA
jgi:hypothetical protein